MILKRHLERLEEFSNFEDGWHNGESKAPSKIAIENAKKHLDKYSDFEIYACPWGGVFFEGEHFQITFHNDGKITTYDFRD